MNRIYLDYASTTPMDERVLEEMLPFLKNNFGNPSSIHSLGTSNKNALNTYREKLAGFINADPEEIIFTSGGTEANNFALKGIAFANREKGNHIIVSAIEHDCILNTCHWLETQGFFISYAKVNQEGIIDVEHLKKLINPKTILVSIMHVNNETGMIQPIEEIGKICKAKNVYFHTDACQSFGKIPFDVKQFNLSLASLNSHKIYGPKGIGCLYIKKGVNIIPLLHGGGQEFGLRSSTENIASISGFVKAAELCLNSLQKESERLKGFQNTIIKKLQENFEGFYINGNIEKKLPNILNFAISGLEGETIRLLLLLDEEGIAVSTGSACSNNDTTKSSSHVLQAMGKDPFESRGAIRVSIGRFNSIEEINAFTEILVNKLKNLHSIFNN